MPTAMELDAPGSHSIAFQEEPKATGRRQVSSEQLSPCRLFLFQKGFAVLGDYTRRVLDNGLCVIGVENPALHSFACDVRVHAGPRFEPREHAGLTHFLEHMIHQGSEHYPDSNTIVRAVEDLGGVIDAVTHAESMEVSLGLHRKHWRKGLGILMDVLLHPLFDETEVEQEKGIVAQEIAEYRDEQQRNICASELAYSLMFKEELDELGTRGSVAMIQSFDSSLVRSYYERFFTPQNMVISLAGAFDFDEVFDELAQYLGEMPAGQGTPQLLHSEVRRRRARAVFRVTERIPVVDVELCHHAFGLGDDRFDTARAAAHILGGGLSSRLFSEVRERRGLVYEIMSYAQGYSDAGSVDTALSVDANNLPDALAATLEVVAEFREGGACAEELERYKESIRCGMEIMCDQPHRLADWFGRQELLLRPERLVTPQQYVARHEALTVDGLLEVTRQVLANSESNIAVVGPFDHADVGRLRELFPAEEPANGQVTGGQ